MPCMSCQFCLRSEAVLRTKLLKCSVCLFATYCSAKCQKLAWPAHKRTCAAHVQSARSSEENAFSKAGRLHSACWASGLKFLDSAVRGELELAAHVAFNIRDRTCNLKTTHVMWLDFMWDKDEVDVLKQFTLVDGGLDDHEALLARHRDREPPGELGDSQNALIRDHLKRRANHELCAAEAAKCTDPDDATVQLFTWFIADTAGTKCLLSGVQSSEMFVSPLPERSEPQYWATSTSDGFTGIPLQPVADWFGWLQRAIESAPPGRVRSHLETHAYWKLNCCGGAFPEIQLDPEILDDLIIECVEVFQAYIELAPEHAAAAKEERRQLKKDLKKNSAKRRTSP